MGLPGKAHFALDDIYFMAAEQTGSGASTFLAHYHFTDQSLLAQRTDITGRPGRQNIDGEIQLWAMDDFSGGEGQKYLDAANGATKYFFSDSGNPRVPGLLKPSPNVTSVAVTDGINTATYPKAVGPWGASGVVEIPSKPPFGGGPPPVKRAWQASGLWLTDDAGIWLNDSTTDLTAGDWILGSEAPADVFYSGGVAIGGNWFYCHVNVGAHTLIHKISFDGSSFTTTQFSEQFDPSMDVVELAFADGAADPSTGIPPGHLFGFGGDTLRLWDETTTSGAAHATEVYKCGFDTSVSPPSHMGITGAGNAVYFFSTVGGRTHLYRYTNGGGAPVWEMPLGFKGTGIQYHLGKVYIVGTQEQDLALYAFDHVSGAVSFPGVFRAGQNVGPIEFFLNFTVPAAAITRMASGPNNQLLIPTDVGLVAYDSAFGAFSLITNDDARIPGATPDRRFSIGAGDLEELGNATMYVYEPDSADSTGNIDLQTSAWDWDIPEQEKLLEGFHVVSPTLAPGQSIAIQYMIDESGDWVLAGVIDDTAVDGNNFIDVSSSSVLHRILRWRIIGGAGAQVFSATARADIPDSVRQWEILVKIQKESPNVPRPANSARTAGEIRYLIRQKKRTKKVCVFKDGYVAAETDVGDEIEFPPGGYETFNVRITGIEDFIDRGKTGDGKMKLTLKEVPSTPGTD